MIMILDAKQREKTRRIEKNCKVLSDMREVLTCGRICIMSSLKGSHEDCDVGKICCYRPVPLNPKRNTGIEKSRPGSRTLVWILQDDEMSFQPAFYSWGSLKLIFMR
jgi:hypothetical protein